MKIIFLTIIFLTSTLIAFTQSKNSSNNKSLRLVGSVSKIEIDTNQSKEYTKNYTVVIVSLNMKLENRGKIPIIVLRNNQLCLSAEIAKTAEELETRTGTFFSYNLATSPNSVNKQEWEIFKENLEKKPLPAEMTYILSPKDTIVYEYKLRLNLPTEEGKKYDFSTWKSKSWEDLKKLSQGFIRFYGCDLRNYGIENDSDINRMIFAKKLQKQWKPFGYLWLDKINSEPILLDFKTASDSEP